MPKIKQKKDINYPALSDADYEKLRMSIIEERRKQQVDFILRNNLDKKKYQ